MGIGKTSKTEKKGEGGATICSVPEKVGDTFCGTNNFSLSEMLQQLQHMIGGLDDNTFVSGFVSLMHLCATQTKETTAIDNFNLLVFSYLLSSFCAP